MSKDYNNRVRQEQIIRIIAGGNMAVEVSENVNEAIYQGKLTVKQMQRLTEAYSIAKHNFGRQKATYRIQFDRDSQHGETNGVCSTDLFIKRVDNRKVFESSKGNETSQIGLYRFISNHRY